jgi:hypothetical protein
MAEGVIDVFEAIEIEKDNGSAATIALCIDYGSCESLLHQEAIRKSRERIVQGRVSEHLFGALAIGNIDTHTCKVGSPLEFNGIRREKVGDRGSGFRN